MSGIARSISVEDHTVGCTARIGIALCPAHGTTSNVPLRRSDLAMYAAKRSGSQDAFYSPDLEIKNAAA